MDWIEIILFALKPVWLLWKIIYWLFKPAELPEVLTYEDDL